MYGIIWKQLDGTLLYCRNTNNFSIERWDFSFDVDIKNIAVLTQEKTAVAVVKKLHSIGFEEQLGGEVYAVPLSFALGERILVTKKPVKHGHAICTPGGQYYCAPMSAQRYYKKSDFEGNMFTATVFKTEQDAQNKIDEIFETLRNLIAEDAAERVSSNRSYYNQVLYDRIKNLQVVLK